MLLWWSYISFSSGVNMGVFIRMIVIQMMRLTVQPYVCVYTGVLMHSNCPHRVQIPVLHSQTWVRVIWSGRQTPKRRGVWWVTELEETLTFISESVHFLCAGWIFEFQRRICVMTNAVSPGLIFGRHKCDVETRSLQFAHDENGFHSEAGDNLCPTIKARWNKKKSMPEYMCGGASLIPKKHSSRRLQSWPPLC